MSLTNPELPVTEARLQEFYERIKPYLGGGYSAGDGIEISNGEISTDNLQSGDMDDIVTPLPSIPARLHKYSTEEQIIGEWIDGKTIYERTIIIGSLVVGDNKITYSIPDFGRIVNCFGGARRGAVAYVSLPHTGSTSLGWTLSANDFKSNGCYIEVGTDYAGQYALTDCVLTIQYTKTTT